MGLWPALAALAAVHVLIAWYPFELDPPARVSSEVQRLDGDPLVLAGERVVAEGRPPWAGTDVRAVRSVTVDLEVRPARALQHGPARILTVSDGYHDANLMIGQERDDLIVRVRRGESDASGRPAVVVPGAFTGGGWQRFLVEVRADAVEVAPEGGPTYQVPVAGAPMRTWDARYPLLVGDERPGGRVWHGEVRRAVVTADGRAVDYLAPGALEIAERAWYVPPRLREALGLRGTRALLRTLLHLLAFVPVGMLLLAAGRGIRLRGVVATAALFGLLLQVGKVAFDGRHPSLLTVVTQGMGALAGAALLLALRARTTQRGPTRPGTAATATLRQGSDGSDQRGRLHT